MNELSLPIEEGLRELPDKPYQLRSIKRALIISDTHFRFHDKRAIEIALNYGKKINCDAIIMLGDMVDFYGASFHDKNPNFTLLEQERNTFVEFLKFVREKFKGVRLIFLQGNHEFRLDRYLWRHSAFANLPELKCENFLKLTEYGVEYFENGTVLKLGGLHLIHGNELGMKGGINIAQTMLLRAMDSTLFGNFHKRQMRDKTSISQNEYVVHAIGCLCSLHPKYFPVNDWQLGFADVELDGKKFLISNHRILQSGYTIV